MPEQLGQLGHYNLLEWVGAGGLGPAFKARDTVVGRTVLVKNVAEAVGPEPGARTRVLRDARAAATISHPNVATLFEVDDRPDQLLLVFEFVSEWTLEELLAWRPPDVRQSLDLGVQLVEAISAAHSQGVLHLDVRPANIKISLRGHAKLLDTGLSAWTRGGRVGRGSVDAREIRDLDDRYRSPEQRRGEAPDHRSDLYSIGVALSEMLTGHRRDGRRGPVPSRTPPRPRPSSPRSSHARWPNRWRTAIRARCSSARS